MIKRAAALWLPAAFAATVLAGLGYVLVQQSLRTGANDPQLAMAVDAVNGLDRGADPASVVGSRQVSISSSLSPWIAVFDQNRHLVATSGLGAEGYPTSVFASTPGLGRHQVTWQPAPDIRQATVVKRWSGGWVVGGRSLQPVEEREQAVMLLAMIGWVLALGAAAAGAIGAAVLLAPRRPEAAP